MKPAKTVSPFVLAAVVFIAVVLALTFTLGRQPPGPTAESTVNNATVEQAVGESAPVKPETKSAAKAQADARQKSNLTRQVINHAINATVFEGAPVMQ